MSSSFHQPAEPGGRSFRWQTLFQQTATPLYLLNPRRRLLFANRAWEECTGLTWADVRGRACRPARSKANADREEAMLMALAPPPEALRGEPCQARRRGPGGVWCDIDFIPLSTTDGLLAIIGRLHPLAATEPVLALPEKLVALQAKHDRRHTIAALGGDAPALERLKEQARLGATLRAPILLLGEPGAGKEWLARAVHHAGPERDRSFACLDCARLPASLVEAVLCEPRGPRSRLGTIYLAEIAILPLSLQARLADMPDDGPRLIAGWSGDASAEVSAGRLLDRLYHRVSTLTLLLPPVRDRREELPHFVELFRARAAEALGQPLRAVSPEGLQTLAAYSWPGNLTELYAVLLAACRHAAGERIELADLPFHLRHGPLPPERKLPLDDLLGQAEKNLIELALRLTGNQRARAADLLGIWPTRLARRMKHFGLRASDEPGKGGLA